jgi:hypothetical protein
MEEILLGIGVFLSAHHLINRALCMTAAGTQRPFGNDRTRNSCHSIQARNSVNDGPVQSFPCSLIREYGCIKFWAFFNVFGGSCQWEDIAIDTMMILIGFNNQASVTPRIYVQNYYILETMFALLRARST